MESCHKVSENESHDDGLDQGLEPFQTFQLFLLKNIVIRSVTIASPSIYIM